MWTKKTEYKDKYETIKHNLPNTVKIYNERTEQWEEVNQLDLINSYIDVNKSVNELFENLGIEIAKRKNLADNEVLKIQNLTNLSDTKDPENLNIEKIEKMLADYKAEQEKKDKGE